MGRMHSAGKGISQSALPYRRSVPTWLKLTSDETKDQIYKLARKGLTPSQIGVILRDSHGVAQVCFVHSYILLLPFETVIVQYKYTFCILVRLLLKSGEMMTAGVQHNLNKCF